MYKRQRYGYVDNSPSVDDNSAIDIDWAVDREGNPVELPGVDFIKVYNGVNQENGWLGECSTEVERGAGTLSQCRYGRKVVLWI